LLVLDANRNIIFDYCRNPNQAAVTFSSVGQFFDVQFRIRSFGHIFTNLVYTVDNPASVSTVPTTIPATTATTSTTTQSGRSCGSQAISPFKTKIIGG
jgi:hypothetical protein